MDEDALGTACCSDGAEGGGKVGVACSFDVIAGGGLGGGKFNVGHCSEIVVGRGKLETGGDPASPTGTAPVGDALVPTSCSAMVAGGALNLWQQRRLSKLVRRCMPVFAR